MQYDVMELDGPLLDAAAAKAERARTQGGTLDRPPLLTYSTDLSHGGPIIERERIALYPPLCVGDYEEWEAHVGGKSDGAKGPAPLIAAMRAYVAGMIGETVDLP